MKSARVTEAEMTEVLDPLVNGLREDYLVD